ncbi:MAG: DNA alkylation repair protein, partial [Paludibacteraceae bacterium]|nr:DNA alkylation repair protein [Paludibacteraceae bacterium]
MAKQLFFNPQTEEQLAQIRRDLHLNMNGVVSGTMAGAGLDYKVIYGTQWPELKKIASRYPQNAALAECLWKMDVRETKILATLLYPVEEFSEERADAWAQTLPSAEMSVFLSMNLLSKTSYAKRKISGWAIVENKMTRLLAYNLLLHISDKLDEKECWEVLKSVLPALADARYADTAARLLEVVERVSVQRGVLSQNVLNEMTRLSVPGQFRDEYANCLNFYCD